MKHTISFGDSPVVSLRWQLAWEVTWFIQMPRWDIRPFKTGVNGTWIYGSTGFFREFSQASMEKNVKENNCCEKKVAILQEVSVLFIMVHTVIYVHDVLAETIGRREVSTKISPCHSLRAGGCHAGQCHWRCAKQLRHPFYRVDILASGGWWFHFFLNFHLFLGK